MRRIRPIIVLALLLCAIAGITSESSNRQKPCPNQCGDGPKDPHCCDGYHCDKGRCVKNP
jgi:hypothetical protein